MSAAASTRLSLVERVLAAVVGVLLGVLATLALADPPNVTQAAPAAVCKTLSDCTVTVAADTKTLVVALALLAGAALLIALLGIRFTKITAGSLSLEEGTVGEVSKTEVKSTAKAALRAQAPAGGSGEGTGDPEAWSRLPAWAKNTLLVWASSGTALTRPLRSAVLSSEKERGAGNAAWEVTVLLDDGEERTLRISTGGGSKTLRLDGPAEG